MATKKTKTGTAGGTAAKKTAAKPRSGNTGIAAKLESSSRALAKRKKRASTGGMELFFIELLENFLTVIKKYTVVKGRASRKEFWMFVLACIIISILFGILVVIPVLGIIAGIASFLFGLATIIPGFTVSVRRLHDINKTGWLLLLMLIPLVGWIILLVLCAQKGTAGKNKYG